MSDTPSPPPVPVHGTDGEVGDALAAEPDTGLFAARRARLKDSPRYKWIVLTSALVGLFSVGFSITVLAVSVATIAQDLDTDRSLMTWVVIGPILAYAVFGPSAGKLADILGARRVYLVSLSLVAVFAALSAVAWSGGSLIAFRVIGATVGAAVGPSSLAMINRMFRPDERAKALGYWSMVAAGGPVIGVVVGGPVVEAYSWRWIFVGQVPLTLLALAIGAIVLPHVPRRRNVTFDVPGTVLLAIGASSLLVGLNRGPLVGWSHPAVLFAFALSPIALAGFVAVERRTENPLLPLRYIRQRNFSSPIANQFFLNFAYMGAFTITPLMLTDILGLGEARIGFLSIARPLTFAVAGPVAGYLTTRLGERPIAAFGGFAILASMLGLSTVTASSGELLVLVALALSGLGMGAAAPAMAAAIANTVDEQDLGVATAFQQMCAQIGVVVGTQIMLTVQQATTPLAPGTGGAVPPALLADVASSYRTAYLVGALAATLGMVAAWFVRSERRRNGLTDEQLLLDELEILDRQAAPAAARP